jgi:cytochrome c biogenesis protein ResB
MRTALFLLLLLALAAVPGSLVPQRSSDPNGVVQFRYRGRLAGWVTARVRLTLEPGRPVISRTFRVKL